MGIAPTGKHVTIQIACAPTRPLTDTVTLLTGASQGFGGAGSDVVVGNGRRMKREQQ
jgi:hypothetical protein